MNKKLYFFLIFIFFVPHLFCLQEGRRANPADSFNLPGENILNDSVTAVADEVLNEAPDRDSHYKLRKPSENFLDQFKNQEDFNYENPENPEGFVDVIGLWIREQLSKLPFSEGFFYFKKYLGYIIALFAIIVVAYIIYKTKLGGVLYSKGEQKFKGITETKEDITQIDLDGLISDAVSKGNFRVAVRYYYLKILRILSEKSLIDWEINKTNYDYLVELKEKNLKKPFADLTYLFEWIWYGEIPVEEKLYKESLKIFNSFELTLREKR